MVGARGFEPPTPGPPDQCANQAALRSEYILRLNAFICKLIKDKPGLIFNQDRR